MGPRIFGIPATGSPVVAVLRRGPSDWCHVGRWDDYWFGMLNRGVIPMGSAWFEEFSMSAQHTDEDVDRTLEAFEDCIGAIG